MQANKSGTRAKRASGGTPQHAQSVLEESEDLALLAANRLIFCFIIRNFVRNRRRFQLDRTVICAHLTL